MIIGAGQMLGLRRTALHPLGSLEDHAYVLADAGIETLIIDPNPAFVERARLLVERVPSLTRVLTFGPAEVGTDLAALAATKPAGPLRGRRPGARRRRQRHLHRRHDRQAEGRRRHRVRRWPR